MRVRGQRGRGLDLLSIVEFGRPHVQTPTSLSPRLKAIKEARSESNHHIILHLDVDESRPKCCWEGSYCGEAASRGPSALTDISYLLIFLLGYQLSRDIPDLSSPDFQELYRNIIIENSFCVFRSLKVRCHGNWRTNRRSCVKTIVLASLENRYVGLRRFKCCSHIRLWLGCRLRWQNASCVFASAVVLK